MPKIKFSDWLGRIGRGALDDRLTAAMADVSRDVLLTKKAGSVAVVFKLTEQGGGVVVQHDVKVVAPKVPAGEFFFVTADGELTRRDPNQPTLPAEGMADTSEV